MKVVAVIPVYNEGRTIATVVARTRQFVDKVIVVDDCSTDGSAEEAKKAGAEVISLEKNAGKTNAMKTAFKRCGSYDIVVMLDGDLQHLPEEIPSLVECIKNGNDLCVGSRFYSSPKNMPLSCKLSNRFASFLVSLIAGQKIADAQSGFRAMKRDKLERLELNADRYAIEHIMILEAARKKYRIKEVPISCIYGGEKSHVKPLHDTVSIACQILKFLLR